MKGQRDYAKFLRGETLTRASAVRAACYVCNGLDEGGKDCRGVSCPLYQFMPYRTGRKKKIISEEARQKIIERFKTARQARKIK